MGRYFQRQDIQSKATPEGWQVDTNWTNNPGYYVDPGLSNGLDAWPTQPTVNAIPLTVQQDAGFMLGLNDCWSLLSWSLRLQGWKATGDVPQRINLIHLDSHTDLSSPRLHLNNDHWQDLLSKKAFNVFDPASVASAVMSGAIGIGSFICPLIASGMAVNLFHLSPAQHFRFEPDQYSLSLSLDRTDPLFTDAVRPHLTVGHTSSDSSYCLTGDLDSLCKAVDKHYPVFLHIDLDYFNNRYDGRPDWKNRTARHDPDLHSVLAEVDKVFDRLNSHDIAIDDISIGVSPGFFPAELWEPTLQRIRHRIQTIEHSDRQ